MVPLENCAGVRDKLAWAAATLHGFLGGRWPSGQWQQTVKGLEGWLPSYEAFVLRPFFPRPAHREHTASTMSLSLFCCVLA